MGSIYCFTYGDLFPAMRYEDDKPYRKNVYTKKEIFEVIKKFGLPQEWNRDGIYAPERYIEAQIWDDKPIRGYFKEQKIQGLPSMTSSE